MNYPAPTSLFKKIKPLLLGLCLFSFTSVLAAPGDLDTDFGIDGFVLTEMGSDTSDEPRTFIQLPDNKILAGGTRTDSMASSIDGIVMRYNSDGSLDTDFNSDGRAFFNVSAQVEILSGLGLAENGKFVGCGLADTDPDPGMQTIELYLFRANSDGTLDTSFGSSGLATELLPANNISFQINCLAQGDGKIILAAFIIDTMASTAMTQVFRYNSDGSPDTSYGTGGTTIVSNGMDFFGMGQAILLENNQLLLAGGSFEAMTLTAKATIARLDSDGNLDNSFGIGGFTILDAGATIFSLFQAAGLQNDGKIVGVGQYNDGGPSDALIARFLSDGSLDTSFGPSEQGFEHTDIDSNGDLALGLLLQEDGKIVSVGRTTKDGTRDMFAIRYLANGFLDDQATFSEDGIQTINFPNDVNDEAIAAIMQSDGKLIVAGSSAQPDGSRFALTRLLADESDLTIDGSADESAINLGQEVTVTVAVTNDGPDNASSVTLSSDMPEELSLVSASPDQGSCNDELPLSCDLGMLAADASTNVTITTMATDISNSVDYTISVSGSVDDPDAENNSLTVNFSVGTGGGCSLIR